MKKLILSLIVTVLSLASINVAAENGDNKFDELVRYNQVMSTGRLIGTLLATHRMCDIKVNRLKVSVYIKENITEDEMGDFYHAMVTSRDSISNAVSRMNNVNINEQMQIQMLCKSMHKLVEAYDLTGPLNL